MDFFVKKVLTCHLVGLCKIFFQQLNANETRGGMSLFLSSLSFKIQSRTSPSIAEITFEPVLSLV